MTVLGVGSLASSPPALRGMQSLAELELSQNRTVCGRCPRGFSLHDALSMRWSIPQTHQRAKVSHLSSLRARGCLGRRTTRRKVEIHWSAWLCIQRLAHPAE